MGVGVGAGGGGLGSVSVATGGMKMRWETSKKWPHVISTLKA